MVKSSLGIKLFLVLVTVMLSAVTMVPPLPIVSPVNEIRDDDLATRVERSTDLTRITGTGKKIRMYIKDKYLQLFNDGTVNATDDDCSEYSILQRTSVNTGQVKIEGVATCTFLCMDSCGYLYSTREFTDECVFNEMLTQHFYNTYSSTKYTDDKRSLYVAMSKRGVPRRVEIKANATLGKHSSCARILLQPVTSEHILELENKLIAMSSKNVTTKSAAAATTHHSHRHHHHLCPPPHHTRITSSMKCRKEKRRADDEEIDDSSSAASKEAQPLKSEDDDRSSHHKRSGKRKHKKKHKSPISKSGGRLNREGEEGPLTTVSTVEKPENGLVHEES